MKQVYVRTRSIAKVCIFSERGKCLYKIDRSGKSSLYEAGYMHGLWQWYRAYGMKRVCIVLMVKSIM